MIRIQRRGPAHLGPHPGTSRHLHRDQGTTAVETDYIMSLPSTYGSFGRCDFSKGSALKILGYVNKLHLALRTYDERLLPEKLRIDDAHHQNES